MRETPLARVDKIDETEAGPRPKETLRPKFKVIEGGKGKEEISPSLAAIMARWEQYKTEPKLHNLATKELEEMASKLFDSLNRSFRGKSWKESADERVASWREITHEVTNRHKEKETKGVPFPEEGSFLTEEPQLLDIEEEKLKLPLEEHLKKMEILKDKEAAKQLYENHQKEILKNYQEAAEKLQAAKDFRDEAQENRSSTIARFFNRMRGKKSTTEKIYLEAEQEVKKAQRKYDKVEAIYNKEHDLSDAEKKRLAIASLESKIARSDGRPTHAGAVSKPR